MLGSSGSGRRRVGDGSADAAGSPTTVRRHAVDRTCSTTVGRMQLGRVGSGTVAAQAAARLEERVSELLGRELLGRAVVDDGIDARVEVGQTVPQHAHRLYITSHRITSPTDRQTHTGGVVAQQ